jgi:hypothetical protein
MKTYSNIDGSHGTAAQLYGVPHRILRVFNTNLYENEFQNPQIYQHTISLFPEHSTLATLFQIGQKVAKFNFNNYHVCKLYFNLKHIANGRKKLLKELLEVFKILFAEKVLY